MTVHEEISGTPAAAPAAWATASQLARALRRREVSSRELLTGYLDRIDRLDRQLGAVVTLDADRAYDEAADADQAIARGEPLGPLHGLPVTVKDSIEVAGMRTTAGAPELGSHVPGRDAVAVARLRAAGAIVFGKTNTPTFAADAQTENTVFGRTSNPWDVSRSPGGSSGGPAAAVAAGLCALDLGSDLGGSIRMPAGYCGVYGLRPSAGLVPVRGHIPPRPGDLLAPDLAVIGPLTRGARDLELVLDAIAGPDDANAVAWRLRLPPPRAGSLGGYRVAVWLDDPSCPVDDEVLEVLDAAVQAIRGAGALVDTSVRPADLRASKRLFQLLVQPQLAHLMTDAQFDDALTAAGGNCEHPHARWARMVTQRVREHTMSAEGAARLAARWAATFRDWDVLLCPVTPTTALRHGELAEVDTRTITVNGVERPYWDQVRWSQAISVARLPAASVPVGLSRSGLPVGLQIVGPYLEDRTVVDVAARLAGLIGGFLPPPAADRGYSMS